MYQEIIYELEQVLGEAVNTDLFASLVTIQAPDGNVGPSGAPSGTWVNVAGLVGIACMDEAPSMARIQATEVKALAEIMSLNLRHVLMSGYYPQIVTSMRAVMTKPDSTVVIFDILGAEADSQTQMTRMQMRIVTQ